MKYKSFGNLVKNYKNKRKNDLLQGHKKKGGCQVDCYLAFIYEKVFLNIMPSNVSMVILYAGKMKESCFLNERFVKRK